MPDLHVSHGRRHSHVHDHTSTAFSGRHADFYDRSRWALRWLYRRVARLVAAELRQGGAVLDVGTGPGQLLVDLARRRSDARLTGIDPSADMVGHAIRRIDVAGLSDRVGAQVASAESLPFPDASFDAVVSSLSSHHWADPAAAIAEQARVLRPGGRLWVFDLRGKSPGAVPRTLTELFGDDNIQQPRIGVASTFLVRYNALKS